MSLCYNLLLESKKLMKAISFCNPAKSREYNGKCNISVNAKRMRCEIEGAAKSRLQLLMSSSMDVFFAE